MLKKVSVSKSSALVNQALLEDEETRGLCCLSLGGHFGGCEMRFLLGREEGIMGLDGSFSWGILQVMDSSATSGSVLNWHDEGKNRETFNMK